MEVSPSDIEAEHLTALAMLTPAQVAAINRLWRAYGSPRRPPEVLEDALGRIYATEADYRNSPGAGIA